ncbi:hypothetical protein JCM6882_001357 [Rhodosporidiobolus microsporus]
MRVPSDPSDAECARIEADLKPRRRKAKRHPLSSGDTLIFSGPSLRSDVFTALDRTPSTPACSPSTPRRPVNRSLLNHLAHAPPGAIHRLTLKPPIQEGKHRFSQVWRVEVEVGGPREPAVLKLFVEALFPYPVDHTTRAWQYAESYEAAEADSYASFSTLQGGAVPYCYGFYRFALPFGETVTGVLLEDLSDLATPLPTWLAHQRRRRLRQQRRNRLDQDGNASDGSAVDSSDSEVDPDEEVLELKDAKPVLDAVFDTLRGLHSAGRAHFRSLPSDFLVVDKRSSPVQTVHTGFATSCSVQEVEVFTRKANEERLAQFGPGVVKDMVWDQVERHRLTNALKEEIAIELVNEYKKTRL